MHIHILGICGTFMSGVALLAKQAGHDVTGCDLNVYPPMSTQLAAQGIDILTGFDPAHLDPHVDVVVVGNVIKRGNPMMEYILDHRIPFVSGPAWLAEHVLADRWVFGVSGTHGKTTTTSLLAWILESAGMQPGFLVGGVPENFHVSARLGQKPYFVLESDEYDSAFFDKRSKFIHYHPKTLIINNLEYDHADIFPDLAAIKQQFHYLVRTVPSNGLIIRPAADENIQDVLKMGCWTPTATLGEGGGDWQATLLNPDGSRFVVSQHGHEIGDVQWNLLGMHNINNALAAIAAAVHAGVDPSVAIAALASFQSVKRRLEVKGKVNDIVVYDDFAHHPTAIATTLSGLRAHIGPDRRIIAVVEFGSYTMRSGVHKDHIKQAFTTADMVVCKSTEQDWGLKSILAGFKQPTAVYNQVDELVDQLVPQLQPGDHVVVMSNAGFGGIHQKLLDRII